MKITYTDTGANGHFPALTGAKEPEDDTNHGYIVEQNPSDKLWYACGSVGRNQWMPVSDGFKDKSKAAQWAKSQAKVDKIAYAEMCERTNW